MASNIQGKTVHSWGKVPLKNRRGVVAGPQAQARDEEVPSMTTQCNNVRFLFIDEIEGSGAETLGGLEDNTVKHVSNKSR